MGDMEDESLAEPVGSLQNKWRLLPHFLAMRGLMKQVFFCPTKPMWEFHDHHR